MNEPALRVGNIAAGALVLGGVIAIAVPGHAPSALRLVVLATAAAAGLRALADHVPPTGWMYPLKWRSPFGDAAPAGRSSDDSDEIVRIRRTLSGSRQRLPDAPNLPPDTLRLLRPLLRSALELDPHVPVDPDRVPAELSTTARRILLTEPLQHPSRIFTARPDERDVSEVVHELLDEIAEWTGDTASPAVSDDARDPPPTPADSLPDTPRESP